MTALQAAAIAKSKNTGCGLYYRDGKYKLEFFLPTELPNQHFGRHFQFVRSTAIAVRKLAVKLGFTKVIDRLPV